MQDRSAGGYCWKCDLLFVQSFVAKMWQSGASTEEEQVTVLLNARLKLRHYFLNVFSNEARSILNVNARVCACACVCVTPTWGTVWRELCQKMLKNVHQCFSDPIWHPLMSCFVHNHNNVQFTDVEK